MTPPMTDTMRPRPFTGNILVTSSKGEKASLHRKGCGEPPPP